MRGNKLLKFLDIYIGIILCFVFGIFDKFLYIIKIKKFNKNLIPSNILLVKLAALGDTVLLIPAIRSLKNTYPDARISIVATSVNKEILETCPYINEVIEFPLREISRNPLNLFKFTKMLKSKRFDLAIDFDQWSRISSLLIYSSKAKRRLGFKTKKQYRHYVYTDAVSHSCNKHEIECFFDILEKLGINEKDRGLQLWANPDDELLVKSIMHEQKLDSKQVIVFHPGCGSHGNLREWPASNYSKLADILIKKYNTNVVITGMGEEEVKLAETIASYMQEKPAILAGKISGRALIVLLKNCKLLVCSNTGVMHIGAAVGVPLVALHGPTDVDRWGPVSNNCVIVKKSISCSPCLYLGFEYGCDIAPCMKLITVDEVSEAVDKVLSVKYN